MRFRPIIASSIARTLVLLLAVCLLTQFAMPCAAQELEPRRWSHLPIDTNFASLIYGRKDADIDFDPVLRIENATQEMSTLALAYSRTFKLFDKQARIDFIEAWHDGRWEGILDGEPASTKRRGFSDTRIRFSGNILGSPPLKGQEYAAYRATTNVETIVGIGLGIEVPTGEYKSGKLINLGNNRFAFTPQIGVVHNRGDWGLEATGSVSFYTDNNDFFHGNKLEQDPLLTLQTHLTYDFSPQLWATASAGFQFGGQTSINGAANDDRREDLLWALTAGYKLSDRLALKVSYLNRRHYADVGLDASSLWFGVSTFW